MKINVSFQERMRLFQIIAGAQVTGIAALREVSKLLDVVSFTPSESEPIGLEVSFALDRIIWDADKVTALNPSYTLEFSTPDVTLATGILNKASLHPAKDRFLLALFE